MNYRKSPFPKKHHITLISIILLTSLFFRLFFFIGLEPWNHDVVSNKILKDDAIDYNNLALSIKETKSFSSFGGYRTQIYPLFISAIYSLFGVKIWVVLLIQIFLDTFTCLILYFISKNLFNNKHVPFIAMFLYALSPAAGCISTRLYTETLFVFTFTLTILMLIIALKQRKRYQFGLTGLLLGIATLTKPITIYFPLIILIIIVIYHKSKKNFKIYNTIILSSIFLIIFLLTIAPWQFYNLKQFNHYSITYIQGRNLLFDYVGYSIVQNEDINLTSAIQQLRKDINVNESMNAFDRGRIYQKKAIDYILEHPYIFLKSYFKGIVNMYANNCAHDILYHIFDFEPINQRSAYEETLLETAKRAIENSSREYHLKIILLIYNIILYVLAFIGTIYLLKNRNTRINAILIMSIIAYFTFITGNMGKYRYRTPIIPLILFIASIGIIRILSSLKTTQKDMI